jgi:hypothetical protein
MERNIRGPKRFSRGVRVGSPRAEKVFAGGESRQPAC